MTNILYHVGVSGGKDSTALLLWMVRESGIDPKTILATFCDTKNEHDLTYDYIRMLSEKVHPIYTINPPLGFFDLALKRKRFPSPTIRFCTVELKIKPSNNFISRLRGRGWEKIVMCSGVRASESIERSKLVEREERDALIDEWRPLLKWSLDDIWSIYKRHGMEPNPLYKMGARRVGCFPCIMSKKAEIASGVKHSIATFDKIRGWENFKGWSRGISTFFSNKKIPKRFHTKAWKRKDGKTVSICTIDDVIAWATERPDYVQIGFPVTELNQDSMDHNVCPSNLGYCE